MLPTALQAQNSARTAAPDRPAPSTAWATSQRAEKGKGEVIQVYRLKYASAADRSIAVGDSSYTVPGVASLLRELFANGNVDAPRRVGGARSVEWPSGAGRPIDVPPRMEEGLELPMTPGLSAADSGVSVVADPARNAVLIRDRQGRVAAYQSMINVLDIPQHVIEVQVQVVDVMPADTPASTAAQGSRKPATAAPEEGAARSWLVAEYRVVTLENIEAHIVDTHLPPAAFGSMSDLRMAILPRILGNRTEVGGYAPDPGIQLAVTIQTGTSRVADEPVPAAARQGVSNVSIVHDGESLLLAGMSNGRATTSNPTIVVRPAAAAASAPSSGSGKTPYPLPARVNTRERLYLITPRLLAQ